MSKPILMPQVGQDLTEGKLVEWRVKVGDKVIKGDIVAVVESEKASFEVEAYEVGTVLSLLYEEGATTEVLAPLMFVGDPAETAAAAFPAKPDAAQVGNAEVPVASMPVQVEMSVSPGTKINGVARSSPLARRLAKTGGLDLGTLAGSGPGGAVVKRDIDKALQTRPAAPSAPASNDPAPVLRTPVPTAPAAEKATTAPVAAAAFPTLHRAWLRKGHGEPIVFIHGFGADLNGWRVLVAAAALSRPILAIDLPGHGGSTGFDRITLEGMADAVAGTLADEGITTADLVGHSLGAAVAVAVAEAAQFTVRSLFLLSPAGLGPDINGDFLSGFGRARSPESLAPWMRLLVSDETVIGPAFVKVTAETRGKPGVAETQNRVAQALFPDGTQAIAVRTALAKLPAPIRVVFGAEDRIIPARHATGLPGMVAVHIFPGIGHMPHIEAREPVARLLTEHLRSAG